MEISARLGKLNNSKIEVHVVSHVRKNDKKYDYLDKVNNFLINIFSLEETIVTK